MNKKIIDFLKYFLFLLIGVSLFYYAIRNQDFELLLTEISHAKFGYIGLSMIIGLLAYISRAYRWLIMLEPLGYNPSIKSSFYSVVIGYLVNLALPRVGELTRCGTMNQLGNIPLNVLIGTVILERIIDALILFSCLFIAIGLHPEVFYPYFQSTFGSLFKEGNNVNLLFAALLIISTGGLLIIFRKYYLSTKIFKKFIELLNGVVQGFLSIRKIKKIKAFLLHTFLIWLFYFLMIYVCFFAMDSTAHLGLEEGFFLLVAGGLGMTAPVQGGIGVYHLFVSQTLSLFNIPLDKGVAFATIAHASQVLLILIVGMGAIFGIIATKRKMKADGKT